MVNCKFGPIGCEYPNCDCAQAGPVAWPLAPETGYYSVNGERVWLEKDEPFPKAAPVAQAEPVAWADPDDFEQDRDWVVVKVAHQFAGAPEGFIPLFAAPVAQVEPRKPLTEQEAKALCRVGPVYAPDGVVTLTPTAYRQEIEAARLRGIREAERAHGIGGSK